MRALLVEDDATMALLTRQVLEQEGFAVDVAATGNDAQTLAFVNDYDAIVLDLALPDRNGLTVLQALRREGRTTPVIVLTGSEDETTTVRSLDAGADDYVKKPFSIDEFRARLRALVRRGGAKRTEQLTLANLTFNRLTRQVFVNGVECTLTAKEFQLLEHFLLHSGKVVTRAELLEKVWDMHFDPGSNVVDVHVTRLRKKLESANANVKITARRGQGFVLETPSGVRSAPPPG
jgi:two-component system OmpR family response regulator